MICGYGRFGKQIVEDLRSEGLEVTIIEPGIPAVDDPPIIVGYGAEPAVLERARLGEAAGFVAATVNQTNHSPVNVGLTGTAVDGCEGTLPVTVNVFADEDDEENTGDGKHSPDAKDVDLGSLRLRAERKGSSDGRVYLIVTEATDSSGNRGINCCTVTVPHASAPLAQTSTRGQAAAARVFCRANAGMPPAGYVAVATDRSSVQNNRRRARTARRRPQSSARSPTRG